VRGLPPFSVLATQNIKVASEDGQEAWVFSPAGRHLQTIDVLTNSMLLTFVYDAAGRLLTVADVDGNVTTIQRDGTGKPLAIVGPFGQTNSLNLDANGYLATVTNPKNEVTQAPHGTSGLLATLTDPKGGPPHEFT
jgi:YD repeat-containing protein